MIKLVPFLKQPLLLLILFAVFIAVFSPIKSIPTADLDPSWSNAYNYFASQSIRYGEDVVFTYGPLGWIGLSHFSEYTYWWTILYKAGLATYVMFITIQVINLAGIKSGIWVALGTIFFGYGEGLIYYVQLLSLALLMKIDDNNKACIKIVTIIGFLVFISMMKFTYAITGAVLIAILTLASVILNKKKYAVAIVVFYITMGALMWTLIGQSLMDLPNYVFNSFEISRGYIEAMSTVGSSKYVSLSLFLFLTIGAVGFLHMKFLDKIDIYLYAIWLGVFSVTLITWKHGFVRHDIHQEVFFSFLGMSSTFVYALSKIFLVKERVRAQYDYWLRLTCISLFCISLISVAHTLSNKELNMHFVRDRSGALLNSAGYTLNPLGLIEQYKELQVVLQGAKERLALPNSKSVVANSTVDIYNYKQNYVLFNEFNWKNRPVFQSYSAYTPHLLQKNDTALLQNPPEFILFSVETIDNRLPLLDDSLWVRRVLHNYTPVLQENEFVLLKRESKYNSNIEPTKTSEQALTLGAKLELHDIKSEIVIGKLNVEYSFLGKIRTLLYKPPQLIIRMTLTNGAVRQFRIIPQMTKEPFLLSPLIETNADLLATFNHKNEKQVQYIEVLCSPGDRKYFKDSAVLSLLSDSL